MIVIKPIGGMCNRMRSIDSAVSLAKKIGQKVFVIWERNVELNCRYDRLFEPSEHFTIQETGYFSNFHPYRIASKLMFKIQGAKVLGRIKYGKVFYEKDLKVLTSDSYDFETLKKHKNILIFSCNKFLPSFSLENNFKPVKPMLEIINRATKEFTPHTVGIHVRRTDNEQAIKRSPLELFVEAMKKEIALNESTSFFVASDSKEVEKELKELFPGKIITYESEINRNSQSGMQDALVDLFCLSRTKKLYGSFWSSFSHTAAGLSGIEEITLTRE